jgi:hypothetical protein
VQLGVKMCSSGWCQSSHRKQQGKITIPLFEELTIKNKKAKNFAKKD